MGYPLEVLVKLTVSALLGGAVGWQREARERPAGLRTHVLVCVGSAVYTLVSLSFTGAGADPGRVAAQVATGMGFLGAGTIIRHGATVRGLTTAASLWAVAAIGLCAGIGGETYWVAGIATVIVLATLTVLRRLEYGMVARGRHVQLKLQVTGGPERVAEVQRILAAAGATPESLSLPEIGRGETQTMEIGLHLPSGVELADITQKLLQVTGCLSLHCE